MPETKKQEESVGEQIASILAGFASLARLLLSGIGRVFRVFCYLIYKARFVIQIAFVIVFACVLIAGVRIYERDLEAQIDAELVESIDKNSMFKREFSRSRAAESVRELMNAGAPKWLRHIAIRAVITEARLGGLDIVETSTLLTIADLESGFNPLAKAKDTTACGVFQFIEATGKSYGMPASRCFSPYANARAQVRHFKDILRIEGVRDALSGTTGRERLVVMFREAYCRHHDGKMSRLCSERAEAMVAKGIKSLFANYKALAGSELQRAEDPGFVHEVREVLHQGYIAGRDIIERALVHFVNNKNT